MTGRRRPPAGRLARVAALTLGAVLACGAARADLLADPRFAAGAKRRLAQFVIRGADPKDAEAVFRRLPDLDPQRWVAEWTRLATPWEQQAAQLEAQAGECPIWYTPDADRLIPRRSTTWTVAPMRW